MEGWKQSWETSESQECWISKSVSSSHAHLNAAVWPPSKSLSFHKLFTKTCKHTSKSMPVRQNRGQQVCVLSTLVCVFLYALRDQIKRRENGESNYDFLELQPQTLFLQMWVHPLLKIVPNNPNVGFVRFRENWAAVCLCRHSRTRSCLLTTCGNCWYVKDLSVFYSCVWTRRQFNNKVVFRLQLC